MNTKSRPAGYVPGAADADGSEDPVPTTVLQSTDAVAASKPRLDTNGKGKPVETDQGKTKTSAEPVALQAELPLQPASEHVVRKR